MTSGR
jgi:hypothetical protein